MKKWSNGDHVCSQPSIGCLRMNLRADTQGSSSIKHALCTLEVADIQNNDLKPFTKFGHKRCLCNQDASAVFLS